MPTTKPLAEAALILPYSTATKAGPPAPELPCPVCGHQTSDCSDCWEEQAREHRDRVGRVFESVQIADPAVTVLAGFDGYPAMTLFMHVPDSRECPTTVRRDDPFEWSNETPSPELGYALLAGAGDDWLAAWTAGWYFDALLLSWVHEVGEFLRYEGARVFPPHALGPDPQGNGPVSLTVRPAGDLVPAPRTSSASPDAELLAQLEASVACMPGVDLRITADGVLAAPQPGPETPWTRPGLSVFTAWPDTASTDGSVGLPVALRTIHRALVLREAAAAARGIRVAGQAMCFIEAADARIDDELPVPTVSAATALDVAITYH